MADDDCFYEEVAVELEKGLLRKGLWAKALVQAKGDEQVGKALYIQMRVEQLQADQAHAARLLAELEQAQREAEKTQREVLEKALAAGRFSSAMALAKRASALGLDEESIRYQLESRDVPPWIVIKILANLSRP